MVAAALSFLMSGLLQLYLPTESSDVPYCHGDISIMWQLPQLLLISFAEVLVSVTGLEFAYSQAPPDFRYTQFQLLFKFRSYYTSTIYILLSLSFSVEISSLHSGTYLRLWGHC